MPCYLLTAFMNYERCQQIAWRFFFFMGLQGVFLHRVKSNSDILYRFSCDGVGWWLGGKVGYCFLDEKCFSYYMYN
ncbi:hypothetical protein HDF26_002382 [Pedobacter cryoconitis]|nr:hypothetical protein [Pedobacter cryoconitis]